jgi:hypothetical protein
MTPHDDQLLGDGAASQFFGGSPTQWTLRGWRSAGKGPRYIVGATGRFIGYRVSDLRQWMDRNTRATSDDPAIEPNLAAIRRAP